MVFDYHVSCQIGDEFAEKRRNRILVCVCVCLCVYPCVRVEWRGVREGVGLGRKYPSIMGI